MGCGQDAGRAGAVPGGDPREALGATPAAPLYFVFVEARRRCGRDDSRAGAVAGDDPLETLGATPAAPCVLCL